MIIYEDEVYDYEKKLVKSNWFYKTQMFSVMGNNEISEIISGKLSELYDEKNDLKTRVFWLRWDNRKIVEWFSEERQEELKKVINWLQFEIKQRDPVTRTEQVDIQTLKDQIDITELIEYITWETIRNTRVLHKCFLPSHDDKTSSFKIYENTNSWYCQWCRRWGDQISFLEHYYWINNKEAVKKFISLMKK